MNTYRKIISAVLAGVIFASLLTACQAPSLLKPEESTTKAAFDEESFNREFYATSVPEETEETQTEADDGKQTEESTTGESTTAETTQESTVSEIITEVTQAVTSAVTSAVSTTKKITTTALTVVDTRIDKKETKSNYKYGVVKIDNVNTYYDIYSNGTEKQTKKISYVTYDSSKYKATTSDLLSEAKSNKSAYSSQINKIISYVNSARTGAGKSALTESDDLDTAACVRAAEMAYSTKLGSKRPDGSKCYTVLSDLGIEYTGAFEITGKNASADAAASALVKKAQADLTDGQYKSIGVGVAPMLGNDTTENPQYYYCIIVTYKTDS